MSTHDAVRSHARERHDRRIEAMPIPLIAISEATNFPSGVTG